MSGVVVYNSTYPDGHEVGVVDFHDVARWLEDHTWTEFMLEVRNELKESIASLEQILFYVFDTPALKLRSSMLASKAKVEALLQEVERSLPAEEREPHGNV